MITLYVLQGPDKGRRFDLPGDEQVNLGRASELVPLTDLTVSRKHAMLEKRQEGWMLFDEGSGNGVFINGVRVIKQSKVKVGDQIRMGSTLLVFGSPSQSVVTVQDSPAGMTGTMMAGGHKPGLGDSSIVSTVPSSDDSVILTAPEPTAAAMAHFRVLLQVATAVGSIFDLDQLLNKVMDIVFEQLRADRGFIGLIGADNEPVEPKVVRYRDDDQVDKISVSQTIIQHVLKKNEGVLSSNAMTDQRFSKGKSVHNLSIRSAICVPLRGREKILGVIHIDSMVANLSYTADQLRLLTAIGLQTGLAMENLRMYQENLKKERLAATGETVASLSHSIKNILQGISGGTDIIERALRKQSIDDIRTGWGMLKRNVDKVQNLTMNMLTYSKVRVPTMELTHLPHILNDCLELVRHQATEKQVIVLSEININDPPVPVDANGIHQAILNLLGNAIDAVEPERGMITLSCQFDPKGNKTTIEVQDNGMGIGEEERKKVFEPFFSTKGQKGTGLGLAVTKKVIEEHEGTIEVNSTLGQGTTFRITLPMAHSNQPDSSQTHGPK